MTDTENANFSYEVFDRQLEKFLQDAQRPDRSMG